MKRRYFTLDGKEILNFKDYPWCIVEVIDMELDEFGDWITLPGWYFSDGMILYGRYNDYPTQADAVKACEDYIKNPWKPICLPKYEDLINEKYTDHKWIDGKWVPNTKLG